MPCLYPLLLKEVARIMGIVSAVNHTLSHEVNRIRFLMKNLLEEVKKHVVSFMTALPTSVLLQFNFPFRPAVCIWLGQLSGFFVREEIKKKNYITFYCQYLSTVILTLWLSCALLRPQNYSYVNSANPDGLDTVAPPVSDLPEYRHLVVIYWRCL